MWIQLAGFLLLFVLGIGLATAPRIFAIPFLAALVGFGIWSVTQDCPRCGHPLFKAGGRGVVSGWLPAPPRECRGCGLSFVVEEYLMGEDLVLMPAHEGERGRVVLVELHDAEVEELDVDAAGKLRLELGHLAVHLAVAGGRSEVWSFRGHLTADTVRVIALPGAVADDDYVMDAVLQADGRDIQETALLGGHRLERLQLSFFSGASLEVECTAARLELVGPGRYVEDWPFESPPDAVAAQTTPEDLPRD